MELFHFAIVTIVVILLCIGTVSAETYIFEGTSANGQYSGTLVEGDDGSAALSLAAVSGGTMSSQLATPAPESTSGTMVSQDVTFDVQNGQGFAGCSVIRVSGDRASAATLVSGTQATVTQEAGVTTPIIEKLGRPLIFEGVYASQKVNGGSIGSSLSATSGALSAVGDTVTVDAVTTGPFDFSQYAIAGSGGYEPEHLNQTLLSGAYARQFGDFGSDVVEKGYAKAEGTDTTGKNVFISSSVDNGSLYFDQEVSAGIVDKGYGLSPQDGSITGSSAWHNYTLAGTGGEIRSDSINVEGQIYTWNSAEFHNTDNSIGRINGTTEAGSYQVLPLTSDLFGISNTYSGGTSFDIYNPGETLENSECRGSRVSPVGDTDVRAPFSDLKRLFFSMWATEYSAETHIIVIG